MFRKMLTALIVIFALLILMTQLSGERFAIGRKDKG